MVQWFKTVVGIFNPLQKARWELYDQAKPKAFIADEIVCWLDVSKAYNIFLSFSEACSSASPLSVKFGNRVSV